MQKHAVSLRGGAKEKPQATPPGAEACWCKQGELDGLATTQTAQDETKTAAVAAVAAAVAR